MMNARMEPVLRDLRDTRLRPLEMVAPLSQGELDALPGPRSSLRGELQASLGETMALFADGRIGLPELLGVCAPDDAPRHQAQPGSTLHRIGSRT